MNRRTTLILLALLAGLGGFYYFSERRGKKEPEANRIYSFQEEDVTLVTLRKGSEVIQLRREGEEWSITIPIQAKGDREVIQSLLFRLAQAQIDRVLEEHPKDLGEFGLQNPSLQVEITLKDGQVLPPLLLGDRTPLGESIYAKLSNAERVFLVGSFVKSNLERPLQELQDRRLLVFETRDIKGIRLVYGKKVIRLAKEGETWKLEAPAVAEAHPGKVFSLLLTLKELKFKETLRKRDGKLDQYGLVPPLAEVTLVKADGTELPPLLIGKREQDHRYVKLKTAPTVYTIDPQLWDDLPKDPQMLKKEE